MRKNGKDKSDLNRSDMLSLRLQPGLKDRLADEAKRDNRSLSWKAQSYIQYCLDLAERRRRRDGRLRRSTV
jgi:hypothetical protein